MIKRLFYALFISSMVLTFVGCKTPTMAQPRQFGAFTGHGPDAKRHSCMALVLTIHRQRGWILRDVAKGCGQVKAQAVSPRGEFVVDYVFTIDDKGIVTADVESPKFTSSNGKETAERWLRYIENSYSRYRNSTYRGLEKRVGNLCVM